VDSQLGLPGLPESAKKKTLSVGSRSNPTAPGLVVVVVVVEVVVVVVVVEVVVVAVVVAVQEAQLSLLHNSTKFKVIGFAAILQATYDFLFVLHCNYVPFPVSPKIYTGHITPNASCSSNLSRMH